MTDGTHYTPPNVGAGVPFLTVRDMTARGLNFKNSSHIAPEEFEKAKSAGCAPRFGDVLFSKDGTVGKVHVVSEDQPFAVLSSVAILTPRPDIDPRYLGHFLRTPAALSAAARMKTGSAVRRIILSDLKKLLLPKPSIDEQLRIADVLDRADVLRARRREALTLFKDLTQAIFLDIFRGVDWPRVSLRTLTTKITKGTTPTSVGLTFEKSGVPFIRVTDLLSGLAVPTDDTLHISESSHDVLARSKIRGGEVLISIAGTIGRIATVPRGLPEMNCNQAVAIVSLDGQVELDYVAAWLRGIDAGRQMGFGSVTATIANLSLKEVGNLQIPVPPRDLQREFGNRNAKVRQNRLIYEALVADQEALFASLQQQAFAGQL